MVYNNDKLEALVVWTFHVSEIFDHDKQDRCV